MSQVYKIVLTGGPCGGKTTAIHFLKQELTHRGIAVFCLDEMATKLKNAGKTPENMGNYAFHSLLFREQLKTERSIETSAAEAEAEKSVILCDRGLLDNKAYVSEDDFKQYSSECGCLENQLLCSYDAVFHLVTAAKGAEKYYTLENNKARSEDIEQARKLDDAVLSVWVGTPHLRILDNRGVFQEKLQRLLQETLAVLGIPKPMEIERKFLILYPDLNLLEKMQTCRKVFLSQTYLNTPDEGKFRVRQRGAGEQAVYIKTIKRKINEMKRIETEEKISEEEYCRYISMKEYSLGTISKYRYCIAWGSTYYELDVFPFWDKLALLEIELLSEEEEYTIPDFVTVLREVTMEKAFRNLALAKKFGNK